MPAQVNLHRRREPSKRRHTLPRDDKRGLGEVVLFRNGLKRVVRQPAFQDNYRRRIPTEQSAREGIDLIYG
jgi:hypothetical protein